MQSSLPYRRNRAYTNCSSIFWYYHNEKFNYEANLQEKLKFIAPSPKSYLINQNSERIIVVLEATS